MDITDLLQGPLKDVIIGQVGKQLGIEDSSKSNSAVDGIFATLLNAVAKNASSPEGQTQLQSALEKDHDGSILDNLGGFLSGAVQPSNPKTANGAGILKHILGDKTEVAAENISKESGIHRCVRLSLLNAMVSMLLTSIARSNAWKLLVKPSARWQKQVKKSFS